MRVRAATAANARWNATKQMRTYILSTLFLCLAVSVGHAQRHETFSDRIQGLQVVADDDWLSLPVYALGQGSVTISFDDLTHDYHRYAYRLEHCQADWTPSDQLFESDYCEGFADGSVIEEPQLSNLTNTLYTHYTLTLPNTHCRPTLSGNYRLTIYDDNDDDKLPVLQACFMVLEPEGKRMGVSLDITDNTDATIRTRHQQVAMTLSYGAYTLTNPTQQLHTVLLQNGQWHDARINARPQYTMPDGLRWDHCADYLFEAGNEYRKFEILSTDVATMGIDHIGWDGTDYHVWPLTAFPRPNYLYDEDADGAFLLRNMDNYLAETESDYMNVHFLLQTDHPSSGDIYLNGNWTLDRFLPKYKMEYDADRQLYEAVVPLKLGYYNYQYLLVDANGHATPLPSEGSFYQTENRYQALVYYRETGGRTDRLVGYTVGQYRWR